MAFAMVSRAARQEHVDYVAEAGAFGRLKRDLVKAWLAQRPERVFPEQYHKDRKWITDTPKALPPGALPNGEPLPFAFGKHDEVWYTREFGDEYSKDKVLALVYRGGRLYMPLVWIEKIDAAAKDKNTQPPTAAADSDAEEDDNDDDSEVYEPEPAKVLPGLSFSDADLKTRGKEAAGTLKRLVLANKVLAAVFFDKTKTKDNRAFGKVYELLDPLKEKYAVVQYIVTKTLSTNTNRFMVAAQLHIDAIDAWVAGGRNTANAYDEELEKQVALLDDAWAKRIDSFKKTRGSGDVDKTKLLRAMYSSMTGGGGSDDTAKPLTDVGGQLTKIRAGYRCVWSVAAPVASTRGRVLARVSLAENEPDRTNSAHIAALVNTAMVLRHASTKGMAMVTTSFMDVLTGNTYCAWCSNGFLASEVDASMSLVTMIVGQEPGCQVVIDHVLGVLPHGHVPTKKLWELAAYREFKKNTPEAQLGFTVVDDREMDFVATGGIRGDMAPNVYAVLLEHRIDTARFGLASTASFLGTASHNVLDYAYKLFGGAAGDTRRRAISVMKTYPAITAAVGVAAYDQVSGVLVPSRGVTRNELADNVEAGVTATVPGIATVDGGVIVLRPDHVLRHPAGSVAIEFKTKWGKRELPGSTRFDYMAQALIQAVAVGAGYAMLHVVTVPYTEVPHRVHGVVYEADMNDVATAVVANDIAEIVQKITKRTWRKPWYMMVPGDVAAGEPAEWKPNVEAMAKFKPVGGTVLYARSGPGVLSYGRRPAAGTWHEAFDVLIRGCFGG